MSRYNCARCQWTPDQEADEHPQEQLADHAAQAAHWLCGCCTLSLTDEQATWQSCETCLSTARALLSGIVTMWTDLPSHLGHLRGAVYDSDRPSAADGRPLPGGDVLVLLGPGGTGRSEDAQTFRGQDAPSVAFSLTTWQDDWLHTRGEPASDLPPSSSAKVVHEAAKYLDTFTRWAAQHHEAFAEYLSDLRDLHGRLERATAQHEHVVRSGVECMECAALLVREATALRDCEHDGAPCECDKGGLRDDWTCPRPACGERYDAARFALAASGPAKERLREHWVTVEQAATLLNVAADTVRKWERRGHVRSDRTVSSDGRLMVWYADVEQRRMGEAS